jgi:hypothetical protein
MNPGPVKQAEDPYEPKQDQRRNAANAIVAASMLYKCANRRENSQRSSLTCGSAVLARLRFLGERRCDPNWAAWAGAGTVHCKRAMPANYYVWRAPGGFSVHLGLRVVQELAIRTAASGETGGILLGRSIPVPSPATMADDFVVIPSSENFESARRAAENDGGPLRAIGYLRSQRDGPLSLGPRDLLTFERWFYENGSVGLLIRAPSMYVLDSEVGDLTPANSLLAFLWAVTSAARVRSIGQELRLGGWWRPVDIQRGSI